MRETFEQFVARVNAYGFILTPPTGGRTPPGDSTMPKSVKLSKGQQFSFSKASVGSKYPWDEWFSPDPKQFSNGLLLLERSVMKKDASGAEILDADGNLTVDEKRDFDVEVDAMPAKLKTAARRRYKIVQINRRDADGNKLEDGLIIKTRDMTAEERQAEDLLRAEEKASRKAKAEENGDDDAAPDASGTTIPTAAPATSGS